MTPAHNSATNSLWCIQLMTWCGVSLTIDDEAFLSSIYAPQVDETFLTNNPLPLRFKAISAYHVSDVIALG